MPVLPFVIPSLRTFVTQRDNHLLYVMCIPLTPQKAIYLNFHRILISYTQHRASRILDMNSNQFGGKQMLVIK